MTRLLYSPNLIYYTERNSLKMVFVAPDRTKLEQGPCMDTFRFSQRCFDGRVVAGSKAICKICKREVACSGRTTNLINHLRVHHHAEFEVLSGTDTSGAGQPKIVEFCLLLHKTSINKLEAGSK